MKRQIEMRLARDPNGNKIVRLSFPSICGKSAKGFAIQTNGNLPNSHRGDRPDRQEVLAWVRVYGTLRQKAIIGNKS